MRPLTGPLTSFFQLGAAALAAVAAFAGGVSADSTNAPALGYRYFTSGQSLWIRGPEGLSVFRYDTRAFKNVSLCDTAAADTVFDVAENGGALWIAARSGIYQVDMGTSTVELLPVGPPPSAGVRIAADQDFVWVARGDALWKFDKLSREWLSFPLGQNAAADRLVGAASDGEKVVLVTATRALHFAIADEKWTAYPLRNFSFSPRAEFFPSNVAPTVVEGNRIYRYVIAKLAWDIIAAPSEIIDVYLSNDRIIILSKSGALQYSASSSVMQPFDIPDARQARGITIMGDTLSLIGGKNIIKYSISTRATDVVTYPQQTAGALPDRIFVQSDRMLLLYPQEIALYHPEVKNWELSPLLRQQHRKEIVSWDDNGARARYAPGFESSLKGSVSQLATFRYGDLVHTKPLLDTSHGDSAWITTPVDTEKVVYYTPQKPGKGLYSDLTLHTSLSSNRYADLFFNKETGALPQKGVFYRGDADDRFESARLGTNTFSASPSQTLPAVQYEGGSAIVHSQSGLATRDRKIFRAQAGGGLQATRTVYTVLPYNKEGEYNLNQNDTNRRLMIVPGSLRITVDGEEVDSLQYSFTALSGDLTILRKDLLDPTSVIIAC